MDKRFNSSILGNLFKREINGNLLSSSGSPWNHVPDRLSIPMESVLPTFALQNGHIFLGFTNCGSFLLSYTIREEFDNAYNRNELSFVYKLYIWLFIPYKLARRVASTFLFSNTGVADNNLLICVSQWKNDDSRLIITGTSCSPEIGGFRSLCYVTLTTLPSTYFCSECSFQEYLPDFDEPCQADGPFRKARCLRHSLTTHLVFERVPPFPKFNFDLQLKWNNSVILNSGNALHIFTYNNISGPQKESAFSSELLIPPVHHEPTISKKRLLRCNFWFFPKSLTSNCLQKILSNCTSREASRILTTNHEAEQEENESYISSMANFLSSVPYSLDFEIFPKKSHSRRLSQSSVDSEVSVLSSLSRSTLFSQTSTCDTDVQEFESYKPVPSPPKKVCRNSMPPPQRRRKFFKTNPNITIANSNKDIPAGTLSQSSQQQQSYDIFDVGVEDVLLERISLSSYRKRRNADKQYEFSDPDFLTENLVPLKLSRNRRGATNNTVGLRSPRSNENISTAETGNLGPGGYPRSPRSILVHSPAMSPNNLSEVGDILRPLSNNSFRSNLNISPLHSLFSPPPPPRDFCDDFTETKLIARMTTPVPDNSDDKSQPTFSTKLNCIAKILRSYVDRDDDNLSVKTDTDDEYSQTLPFPIALTLDVHGAQYQPLQMINNSKIKSSPSPVVEILQRTLEIEILCNEVAGMICLSADKNFISCFDYDVAILDVCDEKGSVSALAVVLMQASPRIDEPAHIPLPPLQDTRQKYEAIFTFVWEPVDESCRILYMGHLREIDNIPEKWHPTKQIIQGLEAGRSFESQIPESNRVRVLTNELAVYEWQSLDELVDPTGFITLRSTNSSLSNRGGGTTPGSVSAFNFSSLSNIDTEDDDLSD